MAYTPELSQIGSATLRRLAWYRGKPMTQTLELLLQATGLTMAKVRLGEVCSKCRDKSICDQCPFHPAQISDKQKRPDVSCRSSASSIPTASQATSISEKL